MSIEIEVPTLEVLLEQSAATPDFARAVRDLEKSHRPSERILFKPGNPPVKVLRAVMGLLEAAPVEPIDRVEVDGISGCSDYRGTVILNGGESAYRFVWDCAWKAEQVGWKDMFGYPDQGKAARAFGYRCFQTFSRIS